VNEENSSGTDSEEDEEGSDVHKLAQIKHALERLHQPVTIISRGQYEWDMKWEEVVYQRVLDKGPAPENILQPL
jgi:uncharacterized protein YhaN